MKGLKKIVDWTKFVFKVEPVGAIVCSTTKIIDVILGAVFVVYLGRLVDAVISYFQGMYDSHQNILIIIFTMLIIGLGSLLSGFIDQTFSKKIENQMDANLENRFLQTNFDADFLLTNDEEYQNKKSACQHLLNGSAQWMIMGFTGFFTAMAGVIVYMSIIGSSMILSTLGLGLIIAVINFRIQMNIQKKRRESEIALAPDERLNSMYNDLLFSTKVAKEIRLFRLFEYISKCWEKGNDPIRQKRKQIDNLSVHSDGIGAIMKCFSIFGLLYLSFVLIPMMSAGQFTVLLAAYLLIIQNFLGLGMSLTNFGMLTVYLDELHDYENYAKPIQHPVLTDPNHKKSDVVKLQNVSFGYKQKQNVIKDVSLIIKSGETVAIVGRNGSGKTTLSNLILGLYNPENGDVFVHGKTPDITSSECPIASVSQNFGQYNALTLQDNIVMGQDGFSHSKLQNNINKVDNNERLRNNLDSVIGNQYEGIELSGGEWQRLALLRPLFTDADIVLFDEPTAALDPISEVEIFKQFMEIYEEKTRIIISHRLGATKEADKIVVMEEGEIIGIGTHVELLLDCSLYSEMYHSQASWYKEKELAAKEVVV